MSLLAPASVEGPVKMFLGSQLDVWKLLRTFPLAWAPEVALLQLLLVPRLLSKRKGRVSCFSWNQEILLTIQGSAQMPPPQEAFPDYPSFPSHSVLRHHVLCHPAFWSAQNVTPPRSTGSLVSMSAVLHGGRDFTQHLGVCRAQGRLSINVGLN